MKRRPILALTVIVTAVLSTTLTGSSTAVPDADRGRPACERTLQHAIEAYRVSTFERDADGFNALLADDVTVVLAEGTTLVGKEATAAFVDRFFANPDWTQTLDVVLTTRHGCRSGFVLFDSVLTMTPGGTAEPLAIGVTFTFERGRWLVLHNQDSPVIG